MLEVMDRTMAGERIWPNQPPNVPLGLCSTADLTERELTVLRLLGMGYSNQEIADRLEISVSAVRFHQGNLMDKTGFATRTELAIAAACSGIAVPGME